MVARSEPFLRLADIYALTALYRHGTYVDVKRELGLNAPWLDRIIEQSEAWAGFKLFDRSAYGNLNKVRTVLPTRAGGAWLAAATLVERYARSVEAIAAGLKEPRFGESSTRWLRLDYIIACGQMATMDTKSLGAMQRWLGFKLSEGFSGRYGSSVPTRAYKAIQPFLLDLIYHIRALYTLTNELRTRA